MKNDEKKRKNSLDEDLNKIIRKDANPKAEVTKQERDNAYTPYHKYFMAIEKEQMVQPDVKNSNICVIL